MYTAPNGMKFNSYWDSMNYCRKQLRKEFAEIVSKSKGICPVCGSECIKSKISEVYICGKCFKAFTLEVTGDESES